MSGLPYYNTGTITAGSADSSLALSGGVATDNIGIGWLILLPDGPSGGWAPHVVSAVPAAGEIDIVPPTNGSLAGSAYVAVRASGMDAKAIADLTALLTSSNYSDIAELTPGDGEVMVHTTAGGWASVAYAALMLSQFRNLPMVDVLSASTTAIAGGAVTSPLVNITNNNAIASLGTAKQAFVIGKIAGTPTFTAGTYLILNTGESTYTASAGDRFIAWSDNGATPIWYITFFRKSGQPVATALSVVSLTVSGASTLASANVSGQLTNTSGDIVIQPATTTHSAILSIINAGGTVYVGADNSTGSVYGKGAYTTGLYSSFNTPMVFITNGSEFLRGNAAGGSTFTGPVNFTNGPQAWTASAQTTGASYCLHSNTSGNGLFGVEGATPHVVAGSGAYSTIVGSYVIKPLHLVMGAAVKATVQTDGAFVPGADNSQNLGSGSLRWGTVYAGTGTINTSDAETKTMRDGAGDPSAAEKRVAGRIRALVKVYQFNDAITAKGADKARLHLGLIAQDVRDAFVAEGLDPNRYGMFCSDPLFEPVERTSIATRPAMETVEETVEDIQIIDGKAVQVRKTVSVERQRMEKFPLYDAEGHRVVLRMPRKDGAGNPVLGDDDQPAFELIEMSYSQPVTEQYEQTYFEQAAVMEGGVQKQRLGLRYDEVLTFMMLSDAGTEG